MSRGIVYTKYRYVIEMLGYKQVDIYRVPRVENGEKAGFKDIVRIMEPMSGKVAVIDLGVVRESLSLLEFMEKIVEGAEKAGLPVFERNVQVLREKLKEKNQAE